MKECQGFFGKVFGHNYNPSYSITENFQSAASEKLLSRITSCNSLGIVDMINSLKTYDKRYEGHVCSRCGDKIIKSQSN